MREFNYNKLLEFSDVELEYMVSWIIKNKYTTYKKKEIILAIRDDIYNTEEAICDTRRLIKKELAWKSKISQLDRIFIIAKVRKKLISTLHSALVHRNKTKYHEKYKDHNKNPEINSEWIRVIWCPFFQLVEKKVDTRINNPY